MFGRRQQVPYYDDAPSMADRYPAPAGVRPGAQVGATRGYREYTKASGSVGTSGTVPVTLTFPVTCDLYGMALGCDTSNVSSGGTAALNYLDMFAIQIAFQTGDQLITAPTIGTSAVDRNTGTRWFTKPWQVPGGQSLQLTTTNLSNSVSITNVYFTFFCLELEVANPNI